MVFAYITFLIKFYISFFIITSNFYILFVSKNITKVNYQLVYIFYVHFLKRHTF